MPETLHEATDSNETIEPLLRAALGPAYNFAVRLTRDRVDAEDLLQEAALRACRFFHRFEPGTDFRAWFFKILANCHFSGIRRDERRGTTLDIDDTPPLYLYLRSMEAGLNGAGADPAAALLDRIGTARIDRALGELPEDYRIVAALYFVEDFRYQEIADVLGIPLGTVRSRLHRGRRMLQKALWDVAIENGLVPNVGGD